MIRIIWLLAALLAATPALAQSGSSQSKSALTTDINTNWADNVAGAITPHVARQTLLNLINSAIIPINVACSGTNDTAAFNTAMTLASSANVPLHIPIGTCAVAGISPPANLVMIGDGPGSILKRVASDASSFDGVLNISTTGVTVANLTVDGNKANETNQSSDIYFSGGDLLLQNVVAINAKSDVGLNITSTLDQANKTTSQIIGFQGGVGGTNDTQDITIGNTTAWNLVFDHPILRSHQGMTTNAGQTTTNAVSNVTVRGADIDCGFGGASGSGGQGIGFDGQFNALQSTTTNNNIVVADSVIRNCGSYSLSIQATNAVVSGVRIINGGGASLGPVLFNAINSQFTHNVVDFNNTGNPNEGIGVDLGGCQFCTLDANYIGPTVAGATASGGNAINLGSTTRAVVSNNNIVIGSGTQGTGISGVQYDAGAGAFGVGATEALITGNNITCTNNTCLGIFISQGFGGISLSGNVVTGTTTPYEIEVNAVQWIGGNTFAAGSNGIYSASSASTVVIPDSAQVVELSGTTTVNAVLSHSQNNFVGKVPFANITNQGSGYTSAPTPSFSGGGCSVEPTATTQLTQAGGSTPAGRVGQITITSPGSGCTSAPTISGFSCCGGSGAAATAQFQLPNEISSRILKIITDGSLTITNGCSAIGSFCTRNGSNITTSAGATYEFVNNGFGLWVQPQ